MSNDGNERGDFIFTGQKRDDIPENVKCVKVHSSVKAIKDYAFIERWQLATVNLY
jgi:hypothetical protein